MKYLAILGLLFSFTTYGVTPISKGQVSPVDGYVFSSDEEKSLRKINEQNIILSDLQVKMEERSVIQGQRIEEYSKYFKQQSEIGPWTKVGYFAAGAGATVALIYLGTAIVKSAGK